MSALDNTRGALARIAAHDAQVNAFTEVLAERALAQAARRTDGAGAPPSVRSAY